MGSRPKRSTFQNRYEYMISTIKSNIESFIYRKDSFLPSEYELAEQFELSKNSIRKGLKELIEEGYVENIPKVGHRVCYKSSHIILNFGYYPTLIDEAILNKLVADFHTANPHIFIRMVPLTAVQYNPYLKEYLNTENLDIISINNQNIDIFVDEDGTSSVLEALSIDKNIYPILNEPFMFKDSLYVQPFIFSPVVLCYNKNHFYDCEVPEPDSSWTWKQVIEASQQLATTNRYGFFFHILSNNRWPIFLLQNNLTTSLNDETQSSGLSQEILKESFQTILEVKEQTFPPFLSENDEDVEQLFLQKKVSMMLTTYFNLNKFKDAEFEYDISPLPYSKSSKTLLIVVGLGINKNSKHKEAAKTFLAYMNQYETQLKIRKQTTSIPAVKFAAEYNGDVDIVQPSRYLGFRETFPSFSNLSDLNLNFEELDKLRQSMKLYLSNFEEEM